MRNGHARKGRNGIDRTRCTAKCIGRVDFLPSLPLDSHHGVTRNGDKVDLTIVGIDAREHGHVASTGSFAFVARVAAQNKHVERRAVFCRRFVRARRLQDFCDLGFFLLVIEAHGRVERANVCGKSNAAAHDECEQHREHDKRNAATLVALFAHAAQTIVGLGSIGSKIIIEIAAHSCSKAIVELVRARHALLVRRARGTIGTLAFFLLPPWLLVLLPGKRGGALGAISPVLRVWFARLLGDKRANRFGNPAARILRLGVRSPSRRHRRAAVAVIV